MRFSVQWAYFTQQGEKLSKLRITSVCCFLCIEGVSLGFQHLIKPPYRCLVLPLHQPGATEQIQDTEKGLYLPDDLWIPSHHPGGAGGIWWKRTSGSCRAILVQISNFYYYLEDKAPPVYPDLLSRASPFLFILGNKKLDGRMDKVTFIAYTDQSPF